MSCFGGERKKKEDKNLGQSQLGKSQAGQQNRNPVQQRASIKNISNEKNNERKPTLTQMGHSLMKSLKKVDIEYQTSTKRQQEDLVFKGMKAVKMDLAVYCRQPEQLIRD